MATGVPLSLLTILLLLAPGVFGLQLFFNYAQRNPSLSRTQWIAWSVLTSIISLGVLYITSGLIIPIAEYIGGITESTLQTIVYSELDFTIAEGSILYIFHLIIIGIGGLLIGLFESEVVKSDQVLDPREPWEYAFDEIPVDGETLDITLDDGSILRGDFNEKAWQSSKRELFLEDPFEIVVDDNGIQQDKQDLGRSVLLQSDAIAYIVFTNEDPNQKQMESEEIDEEDRELMDKEVEELASDSLSDFATDDKSGSNSGNEKQTEGDEETSV